MEPKVISDSDPITGRLSLFLTLEVTCDLWLPLSRRIRTFILLLGFALDHPFAFAVCSKTDVVASICIVAGLFGRGCPGRTFEEELAEFPPLAVVRNCHVGIIVVDLLPVRIGSYWDGAFCRTCSIL